MEQYKQHPEISVIMAVYNGERHVKGAVESILGQTFEDFEFLIVDDASTDATPQILEEYAFRDRRVRIILNKQNLGLTKSLNKALRQAKGIYIARMDADDVALPERLARQVQWMESNPRGDLLGTAYYEVNNQGEIIGSVRFPLRDDILKKHLIRYNPFFHASVMIRKRIIDEVGMYDERIQRAQDYDLWFRIAKRSELGNLPDCLMKRRYAAHNISIRRENEQLRWAIEIRKRVLKEKQYPLWNYVYLLRPTTAVRLCETAKPLNCFFATKN